jgi:hypothetical protein
MILFFEISIYFFSILQSVESKKPYTFCGVYANTCHRNLDFRGTYCHMRHKIVAS